MDASFEINDDYDHLDDNLEYILENVLSQERNHNINDSDKDEYHKLKELFNTILINNCHCDQTAQCSTCLHGGNYIFDEKFHELVINSEKTKGDLIYECSVMCKCKPGSCSNRLVQYGPRNDLKIIDSPKYNSKGVITTKNIPKGGFICEYAGELLTSCEAKNILRENEIKHEMNYVLCLKEIGLRNLMESQDDDSKILLTIVNPSRKGNIGRYLNHSCEPNCQIFSVRIDCPVPKIAIFSSRPIAAGEELCFHYNEGVKYHLDKLPVNDRILCLCGSENCNKYLPNFEF